MEEQQAQQGLLDKEAQSLSTRWLKQVKYENFMECTRRMWDQFTSTASMTKQKRLRAKAEEKEKEQAERERRDKARREAARRNLTAKLKK